MGSTPPLTVALAGAIIVTTPQEVALIDARKAASMFEKVNVPVLGIVENMAYFRCDIGTRYDIFGSGGGKREAERLGVPLLGEIPLDPFISYNLELDKINEAFDLMHEGKAIRSVVHF